MEVLTATTHNGFPVYRTNSDAKPRTYSGLVLKKNLIILLAEKKYNHHDLPTPQMLDWQHYISMSNRKWQLKEIADMLPPRDQWKEYVIDLKPYIDRSHPLVVDTSSFSDAYRTFQTLGLRHLPVIDCDFQVVGILTRHDLLSFFDPNHEDSSKLTF